jgi:hypothetical protein
VPDLPIDGRCGREVGYLLGCAGGAKIEAAFLHRARPPACGPGERVNAQLKNWRILRKIRSCPTTPPNLPRPSRPL